MLLFEDFTVIVGCGESMMWGMSGNGAVGSKRVRREHAMVQQVGDAICMEERFYSWQKIAVDALCFTLQSFYWSRVIWITQLKEEGHLYTISEGNVVPFPILILTLTDFHYRSWTWTWTKATQPLPRHGSAWDRFGRMGCGPRRRDVAEWHNCWTLIESWVPRLREHTLILPVSSVYHYISQYPDISQYPCYVKPMIVLI